MNTIEVLEDSFNRANNSYILMWVVTAIVIVTGFIDFRSYHRESNSNQLLVELYSKFEKDASELAKQLRSAVYLLPTYESERVGVETLRRLHSAAKAQHQWLGSNLRKEAPLLSIDQRVEIRVSLNYMERMLFLNDVLDGYSAPVSNEPSLLFAEHEAGSFLVTKNIENLRFEDATRYLWISTLDLQKWCDALDKHISSLKSGVVSEKFGSDLSSIVTTVKHGGRRGKRELAEKFWKNWISSTSNDASVVSITEAEKRRRASLTLAQTGLYLEEAYQKQMQLNQRADGETSIVTIPIISMPLQLRDAALVTPWIVGFCALGILVNIRRAILNAPKNTDKNTVIGKIPVFCAFLGFNKYFGILVAAILLLTPTILTAVILPIFIPVVIVL